MPRRVDTGKGVEQGGRLGFDAPRKRSGRQQDTLEAIYTNPTPNDIRLHDIESLLEHEGCKLEYRGGSKMKIKYGGLSRTVHMPHPGSQTPTHTVRTIRDFLNMIGVKP